MCSVITLTTPLKSHLKLNEANYKIDNPIKNKMKKKVIKLFHLFVSKVYFAVAFHARM